MTYHIFPIGDDEDLHVEDTTCPCAPEVRILNGNILVIHNSFDSGAKIEELVENAKQNLN